MPTSAVIEKGAGILLLETFVLVGRMAWLVLVASWFIVAEFPEAPWFTVVELPAWADAVTTVPDNEILIIGNNTAFRKGATSAQ